MLISTILYTIHKSYIQKEKCIKLGQYRNAFFRCCFCVLNCIRPLTANVPKWLLLKQICSLAVECANTKNYTIYTKHI